MKAFKKLGIGLLVIIVILIIVSFFLPAKVHVERSLTMNASAEQVYDMVADLERWPEWMAWIERDPNMKFTYGEKTMGEGASYSWSGADGDGTLTIESATPFTGMTTKIEFDGMEPSQGTWTIASGDSGTTVTWAMDADMSGMPIIGKYFGLMMDGMAGPDFERGLFKIDSLLQLTPPAPEYGIEIIQEEVTARPILTISDSCELVSDSISAHYATNFGAIMGYVGENGGTVAGMPISMILKWEPESGWYWFKAAIPVTEAMEGSDMIVAEESYAGKVVKGTHLGDYSTMEASYEELGRYMKDNGLEEAGLPWEEYVDDPTTVVPEKVRTFIYFPIQ